MTSLNWMFFIMCLHIYRGEPNISKARKKIPKTNRPPSLSGGRNVTSEPRQRNSLLALKCGLWSDHMCSYFECEIYYVAVGLVCSVSSSIYCSSLFCHWIGAKSTLPSYNYYEPIVDSLDSGRSKRGFPNKNVPSLSGAIKQLDNSATLFT